MCSPSLSDETDWQERSASMRSSSVSGADESEAIWEYESPQRSRSADAASKVRELARLKNALSETIPSRSARQETLSVGLSMK
ncbi:Uncharacterised protein [uncultured archaeon]|nr:Uncharacterised protein [uncultured archaeon]